MRRCGEREQSLVPARRLIDRDDHDREPAVCLDALRPAPPGEHGLEALGHSQFAFTLFILFQTWAQPLDGWFIGRLGPLGFISAAGLLCGLGWDTLPAAHASVLRHVYTMFVLTADRRAPGDRSSACSWSRPWTACRRLDPGFLKAEAARVRAPDRRVEPAVAAHECPVDFRPAAA